MVSTAAAQNSDPAPRAVSQIAVRLEIGAGTMLSQHQRDVLGYTQGGYHGTARLAYRPAEPIAVQVSFGYWAFPSSLGRGSVWPVSLGFRLEPRIADIARVFFDSNLAPGRTGELARLTVDFGLGMEFCAAPFLEVGPVFRYVQVVQPETQGSPTDARYWAAGVSMSFHPPATVPTPPVEPEVAPEPTPPPPPAPPPPVETPPEPVRLARVEGMQIHIEQQIHFATNSDRIVGAMSFRVLDDVALVLTDHPDIRHLRIEGHTDDVSTDSYNQRLSSRRAASVRAYLVEQGIGPARLSSMGFGESRRLCLDTTPDCRAQNRRVELHIRNGSSRTQGGER